MFEIFSSLKKNLVYFEMEEYLEEYIDDSAEPVDPGIIICSACLCSDRDLYCTNNIKELIEIFHLIMYEEENATSLCYEEVYVCWECRALLERFYKFKWQVRSAQEYIQGLANGSISESLDHTYTSKCLSSLKVVHKTEYDRTYIDVSNNKVQKILSMVSSKRPIPIEMKPALAPKITLSKPEIILGHKAQRKSEIVIGAKTDNECLKRSTAKIKIISNEQIKPSSVEKVDTHYVKEHMTEDDMYKSRELCKQQPPYLRAPYKCMLCIIGLDSQELLEEHFIDAHSAVSSEGRDIFRLKKPGQTACQICHKFIDNSLLSSHIDEHYWSYMCKHCAHVEYNVTLIRRHVKTHTSSRWGDKAVKSKVKRSGSISSDMSEEFPGPGTKRVRDSYPCPECDMVFELARKRRTHMDRHHREGIICDHCKRRFVNKTTLIEHIRLFCPVIHPDPPPQKECPICHKMVRVVYFKGHIRRHQNKRTYDCKDCNKTYCDYTNYKAHLKYSRAHATEFKYRCPMCEKGYSSKTMMQDHFNYHHLGRTAHKCPVCDKALATRRCVAQHVARAHERCAEPAPQFVCHYCGKEFKYKRILLEHTMIHTGERPLSCAQCGARFRHAATLRAHGRRLHQQT